ncbi:ATP synthase F1 subunit delta [Flammeovirgaceae bacterium SG7u.111]|nr:ATP synthase F1 subunit delta [Flammeovirgaceae bacterium SG7u.132]WPO34874.1 ATP synthase F1 subunit delta [Flammeovirgaceae bacterium SG7u.111]
MSADSRVAIRYAKSLVSLADEKGLLEDIKNDMQLVFDTCTASRDLRLMLKSPIIHNDKKLSILKEIFEKSLNKLTVSFIEIISRKNREAVLVAVAEESIKLYNGLKGIQTAKLVTAFEVDKALKEKFVGIVKEVSGKDKVELEVEVDTSILGGFVLTVGDKKLDDSIATKMSTLKRQLLQKA